MESNGKRNSTTIQVQQDIEHFKEQYLHSLGLSLSKTSSLSSTSSSQSSPSVFLRKDSLSSVGTRRDSFSSVSSQEDSVLFSPSASREDSCSGMFIRSDLLSSSSHRLCSNSKQRMHTCDSFSHVHCESTSSAQPGSVVLPDRDRLKEEYIKSLGLSHRPARPKGLPCLKDRVNEFETLFTRSTYSDSRDPHSKRNAGKQNLPNFSASVDQRYDKDVGTIHSEEITPATALCCFSSNFTMQSQDKTEESNAILDSPVSFQSHLPPYSSSLSAENNNADNEIQIPNKRVGVDRALSLDSRREIFEKLKDLAYDQNVIHKAYTEKEKTFVLESFRKSGGRQRRTLSVGSFVNVQTESQRDEMISASSLQSREVFKPGQSITKIINQFESIDHCELKGKASCESSEGKIDTGEINHTTQMDLVESTPCGSKGTGLKFLPSLVEDDGVEQVCLQLVNTRSSPSDLTSSDTRILEKKSVKKKTHVWEESENGSSATQDNKENTCKGEGHADKINLSSEDGNPSSSPCSETAAVAGYDFERNQNILSQSDLGQHDILFNEHRGCVNHNEDSELSCSRCKIHAADVEVKDLTAAFNTDNRCCICREKRSFCSGHNNTIVMECSFPDCNNAVLRENTGSFDVANGISCEPTQSSASSNIYKAKISHSEISIDNNSDKSTYSDDVSKLHLSNSSALDVYNTSQTRLKMLPDSGAISRHGFECVHVNNDWNSAHTEIQPRVREAKAKEEGNVTSTFRNVNNRPCHDCFSQPCVYAGEKLNDEIVDVTQPDQGDNFVITSGTGPDEDNGGVKVDVTSPDEGLSKVKVDVISPDEGLSKVKVDVISPDEGLSKVKVDVISPDEGLSKVKVDVISPDEGLSKVKVNVISPDEGLSKVKVDVLPNEDGGDLKFDVSQPSEDSRDAIPCDEESKDGKISATRHNENKRLEVIRRDKDKGDVTAKSARPGENIREETVEGRQPDTRSGGISVISRDAGGGQMPNPTLNYFDTSQDRCVNTETLLGIETLHLKNEDHKVRDIHLVNLVKKSNTDIDDGDYKFSELQGVSSTSESSDKQGSLSHVIVDTESVTGDNVIDHDIKTMLDDSKVECPDISSRCVYCNLCTENCNQDQEEAMVLKHGVCQGENLQNMGLGDPVCTSRDDEKCKMCNSIQSLSTSICLLQKEKDPGKVRSPEASEEMQVTSLETGKGIMVGVDEEHALFTRRSCGTEYEHQGSNMDILDCDNPDIFRFHNESNTLLCGDRCEYIHQSAEGDDPKQDLVILPLIEHYVALQVDTILEECTKDIDRHARTDFDITKESLLHYHTTYQMESEESSKKKTSTQLRVDQGKHTSEISDIALANESTGGSLSVNGSLNTKDQTCDDFDIKKTNLDNVNTFMCGSDAADSHMYESPDRFWTGNEPLDETQSTVLHYNNPYYHSAEKDNDESDVKSLVTEAVNLTANESNVVYVKRSCSDNSDSTESFYSEISEAAESFHSASDTDLFEERNRGMYNSVKSDIDTSELDAAAQDNLNESCCEREINTDISSLCDVLHQFDISHGESCEEITERSCIKNINIPEVNYNDVLQFDELGIKDSINLDNEKRVYVNDDNEEKYSSNDNNEDKCYTNDNNEDKCSVNDNNEDRCSINDTSECSCCINNNNGNRASVNRVKESRDSANEDNESIVSFDIKNTVRYEDCLSHSSTRTCPIKRDTDDLFLITVEDMGTKQDSMSKLEFCYMKDECHNCNNKEICRVPAFSSVRDMDESSSRCVNTLNISERKHEHSTHSGNPSVNIKCDTNFQNWEADVRMETEDGICLSSRSLRNLPPHIGHHSSEKHDEVQSTRQTENNFFTECSIIDSDTARDPFLSETPSISHTEALKHFEKTAESLTTFEPDVWNCSDYVGAQNFSAESAVCLNNPDSNGVFITNQLYDSSLGRSTSVSSDKGRFLGAQQFSLENDEEILEDVMKVKHVDERSVAAEHETEYDINSHSCDSESSMDKDSLEEDTEDTWEGRIDAHTDNERPTLLSTIGNNNKTIANSRQPSSHKHEAQNESPPLSSLMTEKTEPTRSAANTHPVKINHPMTLGHSLSQEYDLNSSRSPGSLAKVKGKKWKEAEDVAATTVDRVIKSPRKISVPFHLDLASADMADAASSDVEEVLESPSASLHRISSAGAFQSTQTDGSRLDPYKLLERSQSDASLLKRDLEIMAIDDDVHLTAAESSPGQNISECNRVYLDLSRAEAFERVELGESAGAMMRTSSGRLLETIPQDEELKTGDLSYVYASHRSFSQESSSSMEDLTFSPKGKSKDSSKYKCTGKTCQDNSITSSKSNLRSSFQIYSHSLKQKVRQLQMGSVPEQMNALSELNVLMEQAWSMPIYGKDLAYELCDILRTESALDIIVSNLASSNRELMKVSARLLEQSLTTSNRRQIAENGLELVVKMTHDARGDCELAQICTGILESLFKTSEDTCAKVIKLGGLDTITYWCRCNDRVTLKNCAIALSNLALYGGGENQQEMAKHKVPEWLFPLAFVEDDSVRYYALLAIGVLVSNKEIENAVISSGTLSLVLPFIDSHDPAEFAERDTSHRHGRSPGWLKRLIPVLSSKREEAQALAAFHFVMEAGIKSEQGRKEVLYKIGAVDPLKWLASTPNRVASKLAAQALKIIGEEIPHKLSQQVPLWTCDDVVHWTSQVGFSTYADQFKSCCVDGDLLLRLTEEELKDSLAMPCAITRKRFLRELRDLKISSDYTSCDPSMLSAWLQEVGEDMSQYTYQMLNQGVDRPLLRSLTDSMLVNDCRITNGIHRMKILAKIEELKSVVSSPICAHYDSIDGMNAAHNPPKTPIDVFISYRRSNGSQLASLLKVHLQLRGFTVFIDIEKLRAGKFDESLLESVRQAKNFIIVLTQNSLDRCMDDDDKKDWVHREITAAIEAGSNIIPLLDNFRWPTPDSLPEDMRSICYFNAVRWIHDYQDACVDKLEQFLRGEANSHMKYPVSTNSGNNNSTTATPSPKQTSGFENLNSPPYQRAQGMRKMSSVESPVDSS